MCSSAPPARPRTRSLRRIYDDLSALPPVKKAAGLIKEHEAAFSAMQASEVGTWFRHLSYLLDSGESLLRPKDHQSAVEGRE
jgi:hypothetical protein